MLAQSDAIHALQKDMASLARQHCMLDRPVIAVAAGPYSSRSGSMRPVLTCSLSGGVLAGAPLTVQPAASHSVVTLCSAQSTSSCASCSVWRTRNCAGSRAFALPATGDRLGATFTSNTKVQLMHVLGRV